MRGRLFRRAHLVKIDLRTEPGRLPCRLNTGKPTANDVYLIRLHLWLRFCRRFDLVALDVARKVLVLAPLNRLVVITTTKQQHLNRKIDVREAWQPNTLLHSRLLDHQRRAGLQRDEHTAGHLEPFRQARFQPDYLLVYRIDPDDANQLRDQTLFAILWLES